jgi:threonine/homoserine/homoserine lactone efflux protein
MINLVPFLGVAVLVIVTPGQDTALTIRNTLAGGRRAGSCTALGVASGQALWTAAASAGITALLVASEPAFGVLRVAGAAYLVLLGALALRDAVRGGWRHDALDGPSPPTARVGGQWRAYRQGLLSNLGNPKMAVFFVSLLPQFVPGGHASLAALLGLGLTFCLMTLAWLTAYAVAVARAGRLLRRPAVRRVLDGLTGTALVGLGIRLAAERG